MHRKDNLMRHCAEAELRRRQAPKVRLRFVLGTPWVRAVAWATLLALVARLDSQFGYLSGIRLLYILPIWLVTRQFGVEAGLFGALALSVTEVSVNGSTLGTGASQAMLTATGWFVPLALITWVIARLEKRLREARSISTLDPLTGVLSRAEVQSRVKEALERARFGGPVLAFAYVDCDRFKEVNDACGHALGDHVLRMLARRLRSAVDGEGIVGRMGGDEFVALFVGVSEAAARGRMEFTEGRFSRHMRRLGFETTMSFGLVAVGSESMTFRNLMEAADRRMYVRKRVAALDGGASRSLM